jgi:hypothetical protein
MWNNENNFETAFNFVKSYTKWKNLKLSYEKISDNIINIKINWKIISKNFLFSNLKVINIENKLLDIVDKFLWIKKENKKTKELLKTKNVEIKGNWAMKILIIPFLIGWVLFITVFVIMLAAFRWWAIGEHWWSSEYFYIKIWLIYFFLIFCLIKIWRIIIK